MDKETTLEFLQEMYLERDEYGEPAGYLMSPQQMNEIADAMMRGEEVDLPTRDDLKYGRVREQAGRWFNIGGSRGPMSFEEYAGQYGMEQTRRRDSATQGQLPPVTEEQVPMLLQLLQGHDRPAWADVLNAAGFDTENDPIVKRVLKTGQ
jgi:hypothetical protein